MKVYEVGGQLEIPRARLVLCLYITGLAVTEALGLRIRAPVGVYRQMFPRWR